MIVKRERAARQAREIGFAESLKPDNIGGRAAAVELARIALIDAFVDGVVGKQRTFHKCKVGHASGLGRDIGTIGKGGRRRYTTTPTDDGAARGQRGARMTWGLRGNDKRRVEFERAGTLYTAE